jgi:putative transposase
MCDVLGVSSSGYYAWCGREPSARSLENQKITERIRHYHRRSDETYGAPRIVEDLRDEGFTVSLNRVARLMRAAGIQGVSRRRKPRTTLQDPSAPACPDRVNRDFTAAAPNRLWVADITYIPTHSNPLYLAVILDVFSRRIVGWSMQTEMPTELVTDALSMAIEQRQPESVIHHSDQGSQYTSLTFGTRCTGAQVLRSTGSVGDCYDNAMCESFFATLECELIDRRSFATPAEARREIFRFIEGWYNPHRRHSSLGQISPARYEQQYEQTATAV